MWLSLRDVDTLLGALDTQDAEYGLDERDKDVRRRLREYRGELVKEIERCGGDPR